MWKVPLFDLDLSGEESRAAREAIDSGWLTMGERVLAFEEKFAGFIGVRHAVAVSSCTAGLQLAFSALNIGQGDEVICPSLSFVAAANSVLAVGATPIFADIGSVDELAVTDETIARCITERTRAIQLLHYAGQPCSIGPILTLAKHRGIPVIEDCAHAPGASVDGRRCGAFGDMGVFSFFANKNLTTAEGGMITTNDGDLADRLRLLRSHGMTSLTLDRYHGHAFTYDVVEPGYNFRLDEIRAAIGLVQLSKLEAGNARRAKLELLYRDCLAECTAAVLPFASASGKSVHHIFPILLGEGIERDRVMSGLKARGIQTSIHYPPIHLFSYFRKRFGCNEGMLPITESAGRRLLTLPLFPRMTEDDVNLVSSALKTVLADLTG